MRILYFHQHFAVPEGSLGTRSYEMARHLVRSGHEVTMVCGRFEGSGISLENKEKRSTSRGIIDGIRVVQLNLPYSNHDGFGKRAVTFLRYAWRSVRLAMTEKYDLVFATSTPLTAALPGIVSRWIRRKPFVFEVRDLWPELPVAMGVIRNPFLILCLRGLEWTAYRAADGIIGLSPGMIDGVKKCLGKTTKPIVMIPNGADLERFKPRESGKDETTEFSAVFTGTHGLANGLDAVLDAARQLRHRPDITIVLIGDGKMKPKLVARARAEKLDNCVFLDPLPKNLLAERLRSADAGLMILANVPAFAQGTSPNKFFDYLAAGLPVVVNYSGWMADMVTQEKCGVAVAAEDPEALAEALIHLAEDPNQRAEMSRFSRALAERDFDRNAQAAKLEAFLLDTAGRRVVRRFASQ